MDKLCSDWPLGQVLALEQLIKKLSAAPLTDPQQMLPLTGRTANPVTGSQTGNLATALGPQGTTGLQTGLTGHPAVQAPSSQTQQGLAPPPPGVSSTHPSDAHVAPPSGASPGLAGGLESVLKLLATQPEEGNAHQRQLLGAIDDPTVHLRPQHVNKGEKPLLITDFASDLGGPCDSQEQILSEGQEGQSIVLKSASRKVKLDNISPAQWISANARILAELLHVGKLQATQVPNYLAYTAKVGDLALRYSWSSVLHYDYEYRFLQAQYQFEWSKDVPHLATTRLRERLNGSTPSSAKSQTKKPVCRNFNTKGCSFTNCSYRHVCSEPGCGKAHSKVNHSNNA